jgi:hypothetical protein
MFDITDWVPLVQSFIGALGGFVVAAYTVAKTSQATLTREEANAKRAAVRANSEHLRARLEELVHGVEAASQRVTLGSINLFSNAGRTDGQPFKAVQMHEALELLVRPATLQRLYFPSLEAPFRALITTLIRTQSIVSEFAVRPPEAQRERSVAESYAKRIEEQIHSLGEASLALYAQCRALLTDFDVK